MKPRGRADRRPLVFLVLAALMSGTTAVAGAAQAPDHHHADHVHSHHSHVLLRGEVPADRPARGLVYDGLRAPARGGPCDAPAEVLLEVRGPAGDVLGCTHGPDPAPAGVEVGLRPTTSELTERTSITAAEAGCVGDGTSGYRVQAIYAHPANTASRYATVAPMIRSWAVSNVDAIIATSAVQTGGARQVRFVTDLACQLVVLEVRLSSAGDDTFGNTVSELSALGYTSPNRKYLVWMDAPGPYCGIGETYLDDRDVVDNYNNGRSSVPGMFARVDAPCWGSNTTPVEAHELIHTLGAVQSSAPHSTGRFPSPAGGHCTDEADVMCYDDDGKGPAGVTLVCPSSEERRLDCGDDDYFHTSPSPGSYLDTHWNTANSRFLDHTSGPIEADPPPSSDDGSALVLTASKRKVPAGRRVRLRASSAACQEAGEPVKLTGRGRTYRAQTNDDCVATFRVRVSRKTAFRASTDPERVEEGSVSSNRVVVKVRRR